MGYLATSHVVTWRSIPREQGPQENHLFCCRYKSGKNKWFFQKLRF